MARRPVIAAAIPTATALEAAVPVRGGTASVYAASLGAREDPHVVGVSPCFQMEDGGVLMKTGLADGLEACFENFEQVAKVYQWPQKFWALEIVSFLTREA